MNRLGGVEALWAGQWIEVGRARSSSGLLSAGPWVDGRVWGCDGLGVEAEELMLLLGWGSSSTLRLAMQVLGKLNLLVNCRFASTHDH